MYNYITLRKGAFLFLPRSLFFYFFTVRAHISSSSHFFASARRSLCSNVRLVPIHTVTLYDGISEIADLGDLAFKNASGAFLYTNVPVGISRDTLARELHNIIYKHKLTPVFLSVEAVKHFSSEQAFDVVLSVPDALYQFSLSRLAEKETRDLIKQLVGNGKTVIFGSDTGFDACPYKNLDFYLKYIKRALGKEIFGYYLIRHNRLL